MRRLILITISLHMMSLLTACGLSPVDESEAEIACGQPIIIFASDKAKMVGASVSDDFWNQIKDHKDKYKKCMKDNS